MFGTAVRRRVLCAGAVVFAAVVLLLFGTGETRVLTTGDHMPGEAWTLWMPVALGMLLIRWIPPWVPEREMAERLHATMKGRAPGPETVVLVACLAGFLVSKLLLDPVFGAMDPGLAPLSYHTSKFLFLLFVPLMLIGASGVMRNSQDFTLPKLAVRVFEPWRWAGLVPVVGYLVFVLIPWAEHPPEMGSVPEHYDVLAALAIGYIATALLEVVFFQGFLQTRLEVLFGRWPAIVLVALVYALTSLVGATFPSGVLNAVASAIAVQGAAALLYGYLWSRYRNIWLNFLLQFGVVTLIVLPVAAVLWS
ncbi:type II CAAX endopeptidase family protein [Allosalinactinospora lopnorensis]|uniref:type II CAAX endopeptidase family protein n=1 Tax=Allosalinactinospora lopnorensis TaxID=1352348 RepID=UPI000697958D|nr:type II CAAX endopeptidase family protein [Allosalinactinospora lopnorensis]